MKKILIKNGKVLTPFTAPENTSVLIEEKKISQVGSVDDLDADGAEIIDAGGMLVCPGFIDIHVHGAMGADFVDGSAEGLQAIVDYHLSQGVTSLYATTTAAPLDDLMQCCRRIRDFRDRQASGAEILGVHLEGPYISDAGCHDPAILRPPEDEDLDRILGLGGLVKRITIAPEFPGAVEFIRKACVAGIIMSAGHSQARYNDVEKACAAGLSHVTHMWSVMSSIIRIGPYRHSGLIEAALEMDCLTTEILTDGVHYPPELIRLALKCKGKERLCLISDAIRAAGLKDGVYQVAGMDAIIENGVAYTNDRTKFAGSICSLDRMVKYAVLDLELNLPDVIEMATLTPAKIMRIDNVKGAIRPGADADITCREENTLDVGIVIKAGEVVGDGR